MTQPAPSITSPKHSLTVTENTTSSAGTLIIRNLFALALNGRSDARGRQPTKGESLAGRSITESAFARLEMILPSFKPVNTKGISLSVVQEDVAVEIFTALKKPLPATANNNNWKEEDSSGDNGIDTGLDNAELDQEETEKEEDNKRFTPGFIREWWVYHQALPSTARPLFFPHARFKDAFARMQERAFPPILIKSSGSFSQTSYGKHTTTMESLSTSNPDVFSEEALQEYLEQKFTYLRYTKERQERDVPCERPAPSLPHNTNTRSRFVVDNMISTDGRQLHVLSFDTRKGYRSKRSFQPIHRIEKLLPDEDAVRRLFGKPGDREPDLGPDSLEAMTGVEGDTGGRCGTDVVDSKNGSSVSSQVMNLVTHKDVDTDAKTGLPSIKEIESVLPPLNYATVDELETALKRWHLVEPVLHGFYGSGKVKGLGWELSKSKEAEVDWAISSVLRHCKGPTVFVYGNGKFRTGLNLASPHESFRDKFAVKATAEGHVVVFGDEYFTSTMCATCVERGIAN
ncbi:hypothetical protein EDD21DRAFT_417558 [Dissophora ornata]|nr:hypothetical protein EDD21DRAFT_417558 [Dissophora ornata]